MFETYNPGNGKEVFICRRVIEFDDKCIRFHVIIKLFQRTGEYKVPVFYHLDIITHGLNFRQNVRGKQDGMIDRNLFNQFTYFKNLIRVQTIRRFIQHDKLRIMHDRLRYSQPLLVSARKITNESLAEMGYTATLFGYFNRLLDLFGIHESHFCGKRKIFIHRVIRIQGWFLRKETDILFFFL